MTESQAPKESLSELFRQRLDDLEREALRSGLNLTALCKRAGISRATPDRWRRRLPKTIQIIDSLEVALTQAKAGAPPAAATHAAAAAV